MAGNFMGTFLCCLLGAGVFISGCTFLLLMAFPIVQITVGKPLYQQWNGAHFSQLDVIFCPVVLMVVSDRFHRRGVVYMYECPAAPVIPVCVMVCGILTLLVMAVFTVPKFLCPTAQSNKIWTVCILCLVLSVFIWFLYGSYQVYSVYPPNYNKNITGPNRINSSVYTPTTPDNKLSLTLENQNQTWIINNNQTLRKPVQTFILSHISSKTNREHLNVPHAQRVMAAVPYCDRTVYLFAFWTNTLVYVLAASVSVIIVFLYGGMKILSTIKEYLTT